MNLTRDLIFLVLYLIGVFSIVYWRKQKKDPSLFFYGSTDIYGNLNLFCRVGNFYSTFYFWFHCCSLVSLLFLISQKNEGCWMVFYSMFSSSVSASTCLSCCMKRKIFSLADWSPWSRFHCYLSFYLVFMDWLFFFWNGVTVLRRESHSLANLLTLILAIFLTLFLVLTFSC